MLSILSRVNALLSRVILLWSALLLTLMVVLVGYMVWGRYVVNVTPTWVDQLVLVMLLYLVLPLAAVGVRDGFHLSVRFFVNGLPERARRVLDVFGYAAILVFGAMMTFYGWELFQKTQRLSIPMLPLSRAYTYLPLVICGVLLCLFCLESMARIVRQPQDAGAITSNRE